MTTKAAANLYLAQHVYSMEGKGWAIYNPHNKSISELPVIYGFNNGGYDGWWTGVLLCEDGAGIGSHICSHEDYMPNDLGILDGSRPDRHEEFMGHYPDGYRMEFVSYEDAESNKGLLEAIRKNQELRESSKKEP